jgi:hypothetical protein
MLSAFLQVSGAVLWLVVGGFLLWDLVEAIRDRRHAWTCLDCTHRTSGPYWWWLALAWRRHPHRWRDWRPISRRKAA